MSTRETSPEIASLAGRILARGNPFNDPETFHDLVDAIARANTGKEARKAVDRMLKPYFDDMLSLAGSCLSQAEEDDGQPPVVTVRATVEWERITNAIIGAFEGGSVEWAGSAEYTFTPDGVTGNPLYAEDEFWAKGGRIILTYDDPEVPGRLAQKEFGLPEIKAGLRLMAEKSPRHFNDLLTERDDAITHDVFLQYVVFGEIIYG